MWLVFFGLSQAYAAPHEKEITESQQCCGQSGISYCDLSAGHYVCKSGDYSTCICTENTPVTSYKQFLTGCCLWHGGIAVNEWGEVICADGTVSEVCSEQSLTLDAYETKQIHQ